jgi:hypothetical protein
MTTTTAPAPTTLPTDAERMANRDRTHDWDDLLLDEPEPAYSWADLDL